MAYGMDDRRTTLELAAALGVDAIGEPLATLCSLPSELTEWSVNPGAARGTLRVSAWTMDRTLASTTLARLAPDCVPLRDALIADDYEGLGLAFRDGEPPSVRWWGLAADGAALARRVEVAFPEHRDELARLLAATGGAHTACGLGLEAHRRATLYAQLRTPAVAVAVLEHARVVASPPARWFFRELLGLGPEASRPWPKLWVGRSIGCTGGWKFYYFARGDELRRTDAELLDAIAAGPGLRAAWRLLRAHADVPWIQLLGLTIIDEQPPSFTAYLAPR
jgi:hypothetical protein